jgi:thymidylate synthase
MPNFAPTFTHDSAFNAALQQILDEGEHAIDRTGTGTISLFGLQMVFPLWKAFPAITTKKLAWKSVIGELLWFLEGSEDNERLAEITFGDATKRTIWTPNAIEDGNEGSPNAWLTNPYRQYVGHLGRVYGVQWRRWRSTVLRSYRIEDVVEHEDNSKTYLKAKVHEREIDQIAILVDKIKNNPKDRRMILTAYNVGELDQMALPPCHMFAQFHVNVQTNRLSCQVYMRSNDMFLGAPFNIASYAALTHMLAQVTGREVGTLTMTIGDAHIYSDHVEQVKEQLSRTPFNSPQLELNKAVQSIDDFKMDDFKLVGYQHHETIKAKMSV